MSTARNARITVELEAGAEPIRGSIEHPDGSRRRFWGWLELSEALHRLASDEPDRPFQPPQANPGGTGGPTREFSRGNPQTPGEEHP